MSVTMFRVLIALLLLCSLDALRVYSGRPSFKKIESRAAKLEESSGEVKGKVALLHQGTRATTDDSVLSISPIPSVVGAGLLSVLLGHADVAAAAASVEGLSALPVARFGFDLFINTLSLLFLCRTVMSWYPKTDLTKFPYIIAAWPTEPLLVPVRSLIPPAFGVDVSAIVWVMLLSFLREILAGQQGILTLLERQ